MSILIQVHLSVTALVELTDTIKTFRGGLTK